MMLDFHSQLQQLSQRPILNSSCFVSPFSTPTLCHMLKTIQGKVSRNGRVDIVLVYPPPILSVTALCSDKVLILMVDILDWVVEASSGAAVGDVVVDVEVELLSKVVVLDKGGAELMELNEEDD